MSYEVRILADSISPDGVRLTTLYTSYPRFIHSEMLRHRMFSHSVASSRAIPTERLIEQVRENPFVPETFNKRVKGMGVGASFDEANTVYSRSVWLLAAKDAADSAEELMNVGLDKSRANRLLEPFMWCHDIITATEWDNFFALRDHEGAQPEFQVLAKLMRTELQISDPQLLEYGQWHLPLVSEAELKALCQAREEESERAIEGTIESYKKISASRCARISFDDISEEPIGKTIARADMLIGSGHFSPFEHVAKPLGDDAPSHLDLPGLYNPEDEFVGNLRGWVQMRKEIINEARFDLVETVA